MKHAIVTGGAGFIGSHLVESLLQGGYRVHVIDDLSGGTAENLSAVQGDPHLRITFDTILNASLMDEAIAGADIVFHFAAAVGVQRILERPLTSLIANLRGTDIVLEAADRYRCPVILASTSEVYGKNDSGSLREDADRILGPATLSRWHYATAKAADEALALAYHEEHGLRTMVLRFFNTVGPRQTGQYGMVVPRLVRQALHDAPLTVFGSGEQTRCFTDVRDVVRAVVALARCDAAWGEIVNIGSENEIAIDALARRVIRLTGSRSEIVHIPYAEAYARGYEDMRRRVPDLAKLRRLIGFAPETPLDESLGRIIRSQRRTTRRNSAPLVRSRSPFRYAALRSSVWGLRRNSRSIAWEESIVRVLYFTGAYRPDSMASHTHGDLVAALRQRGATVDILTIGPADQGPAVDAFHDRHGTCVFALHPGRGPFDRLAPPVERAPVGILPPSSATLAPSDASSPSNAWRDTTSSRSGWRIPTPRSSATRCAMPIPSR